MYLDAEDRRGGIILCPHRDIFHKVEASGLIVAGPNGGIDRLPGFAVPGPRIGMLLAHGVTDFGKSDESRREEHAGITIRSPFQSRPRFDPETRERFCAPMRKCSWVSLRYTSNYRIASAR